MDRQRIAIIIAVVGFALFAFLLLRPGAGEESHGDNNANFPDGTWWQCTDASCAQAFNLTIKQLSDHHERQYGKPVPCPKCGTAAIRANQCVHCEQVFPQSNAGDVCPHCGKSQSE